MLQGSLAEAPPQTAGTAKAPPPSKDKTTASAQSSGEILVVGAGPVGIRMGEALRRHGLSVTVLSAESLPPYNRVRLTPLLGGDVAFGDITLLPADSDLDLRMGCRVVQIDRKARQVVTANGKIWPYQSLVLATGSDAHVPNITGRDLPGVFTFRTAADASALMARSFSARRVVVVGGGLLGLEAARGMRRRGARVTVVEHESRLMPRQLDEAAGARLEDQISELGVEVLTSTALREICGNHRVDYVRLGNGRNIPCDTVIICTGVRANTDLARMARLSLGRGIMVDAQMRTSDPNIFAIGECAEHQGQLYGLVGPGFAQADVAAEVLAGGAAQFTPQSPATKLKVIGAEVFSVGDIEQLDVRPNVQSVVWEDEDFYRRIFIDRGQLVGALGVGGWDQASRVQDAVQHGDTVLPWMLWRFRQTGDFWQDRAESAAALPDSSILCNCTGVTCGQARGALAEGCVTADEVSRETGASSVCGTCRPLLDELVDSSAPPKPMPLWKPVLGLSLLAAFGAVIPLLTGHVPLPQSYDADSLRIWLWQDKIVKQWSGFILLGLTLAAFVLGLRKRIRWMDALGSFDAWRLVHIGIGIASLAGLLAHTGFNLGAGLNFWLGGSFMAALAIGAAAGLATGGDHELRSRRIGSAQKPPRTWPTWLHILLLWPIPVLVVFHMLASYAF